MGGRQSLLLPLLGVPGLIKLCAPWIVRIDPSSQLEPGLRCAVDASAFIHPLLQRHRAAVMLAEDWSGFDSDVSKLLDRLRRNSTGGPLDVIYDGVRAQGKVANASRWAAVWRWCI